MNENVNQKALYMFCHTTLETEQTRFSSPEKNNGAPPVAPIEPEKPRDLDSNPTRSPRRCEGFRYEQKRRKMPHLCHG